MNKFKEIITSKKFLVTIAGIVVAVANDYFGLHLSKDTIISVETVAVTYILGQSHVDAKKVSNQ